MSAELQTAASATSAQGVFHIFKFAALEDGDTFVGPSSPSGFWAMNTANPSTQGSAGIAVTESSGTYTFYPAENGLTATLFVVE